MQSPGSRLLFPIVLTFGVVLANTPASAATPGFSVTATNITMPSNGVGSSPFTLTSVGGYAGQVRVSCAYSGGNMGARVPSCGIFVNPTSTLKANQTAQGSLTLVPYGKTIAYGMASLGSTGRSGVPLLASGLFAMFLLGWRTRNRARSSLLLFALAAIAGISACGSGMSGTFPYTVTAVDTSTGVTASAPFTVTVP